jgi:hypothetical protein
MITITWEGFPSEVPGNIRKDIVEAIRWTHESIAPSDELLATRMINLYLMGINSGINQSQQSQAKLLKSFGKVGA